MREPLWSSGEIRVAAGGVSARPWFADGVQFDSRAVLPGDLFVALTGETQDGHKYVQSALDNGAASALISHQVDGMAYDDPRLTRVEDTTAALDAMARHARDRAPAIRIAVTGSVGKTSTVQGLAACLRDTGETHASYKSYNNHVGVPLSLARMPRSARHAVFELGMNAPGEIRATTALVKPQISVITTVGMAHRAGFASTDAIAAAKAEIFDGQSAGDLALLGRDHDYAPYLLKEAEAHGLQTMTFSARRSADICLMHADYTPTGSFILVNVLGDSVSMQLRQPGQAWVSTCLAVLGAVKAAGGDVGRAAVQLSRMEAEPGRGRMHRLHLKGRDIVLIDDSYNANPISMSAALSRMALYSGTSRKLAVLGDMSELGEEAERAHQALVPAIKAAKFHHIYAAGDMIADAARAAGAAVDRISPSEVRGEIERGALAGDIVLIKGSNSVGLHDISSYLISTYSAANQPFDVGSPANSRRDRPAERMPAHAV